MSFSGFFTMDYQLCHYYILKYSHLSQSSSSHFVKVKDPGVQLCDGAGDLAADLRDARVPLPGRVQPHPLGRSQAEERQPPETRGGRDYTRNNPHISPQACLDTCGGGRRNKVSTNTSSSTGVYHDYPESVNSQKHLLRKIDKSVNVIQECANIKKVLFTLKRKLY